MRGLTNSVSGGGAGGEIVAAINNTGEALEKGSKVWLNKHNLDVNEAYQLVDSLGSGYQPQCFFDKDNNPVCFFPGTRKTRYAWNYLSETKEWDSIRLPDASQGGDLVYWIDGFVFSVKTLMSSGSDIAMVLANKQNPIDIKGYYVGDGIIVKYVSGALAKLTHIDTTTWELGDDICVIEGANKSIYMALKDGNTLFILNQSAYFFYDITDIAAPQLIYSKALATSQVLYATGCKVGDYFFCSSDANGSSPTPIFIYQVGINYALDEPEGLPDDLEALIGVNGYVQYNNESGLLTIGTANNVYAWQFENGKFVPLNITISLPTEYQPGEGMVYGLSLSNDLTSAVVRVPSSNSASAAVRMGFYKLTTSGDEWYAEGFKSVKPLSLSGVTQEVAEPLGLVKVKTVVK